MKNLAVLHMIFFICLFYRPYLSTPISAVERAIAVTDLKEGEVKIWERGKWEPVLEGQRIQKGSILETDANGRILLQFRDGSWLRLFQNTRISLSSETIPKRPSGRFERKWILTKGLFSTKLVPGRQWLEIKAPNNFEFNALEGVLSLSHQESGTSVAVSRGTVHVRNARSGISLKRGQRLDRVGPLDLLSERIQPIPNILLVNMRPSKTKNSGSKSQTLKVTIQLSRYKLNRELQLSAPFLLSSFSSFYPQMKLLMLNSRGSAQFNIPLHPLLQKDPGSDGRVSLMVTLDSREAISTVAGFSEFYVLPSEN